MKIVFLGDSITEGWFEIIEKPDGEFEGINDVEFAYITLIESRLKERFPDTPVEIINAGIGGNTSSDGLARLERDVIAKAPDISVVCFGLNDMGLALEEYKNNLCEIFKRLKAANIKPVFMTPNMTNSSEYSFINNALTAIAKSCAERQTDGTMDLYMETARSCADEYGVELCDAYAVWKKLYEYGINTNELLSNHINHPTRAMHRLFADLLEPVLIKLVYEIKDGKQYGKSTELHT